MEKWTREETKLLKDYLEDKISKADLIEALPDRTWNGIRQKINDIQNKPNTTDDIAKMIFMDYLGGMNENELAIKYNGPLDDVEHILRERWESLRTSIKNYGELHNLGSYKLDRESALYFLKNYKNTDIINNKFAKKAENRGFAKRWTKEENAYLAKCLEEGQKPIEIHIPGRSYGAIKARVDKGNTGEVASRAGKRWTEEEDKLLLAEGKVPGRTEGSCRSRLRYLENLPVEAEWTEEEEGLILERYLRGLPLKEIMLDTHSEEATQKKLAELKKWATDMYKQSNRDFVTLDKLYGFLYG